jgi:serine/threonine-protein kinase
VTPEAGDAAESEPSAEPEAAKEEPVPSEPRRFGRFELLAELGRGGQGLVFRARDPGLGRVVALKVLRGAARAGPEARARFEAEARAMAAVRHPNLVSIYEVGEVGGEPYYTMDYVAGRDLGKILAEGPVPPRQAAEWVRTLAGAVQVAHDHGVLHLDLKPSNVVMDEAGVPHIADFGLAKWIEGDAAFTLTLSHQVLGSPHYMAPEQAAGRRRAAGPTTDVYGLGAILYHLLTGRPPFEGESPATVLRLVLEEEVLPPRRLRPGVPATAHALPPE